MNQSKPGGIGRSRDFTRGSIPKHLIAFAMPMFIGNLLQALYSVVDSIWVGRFLGSDALAAVSVSFPVLFAMVAMIAGIAMATTTMIAQFAGAKDHKMVEKTIINSLLLLTLAGLAVTIIGYNLRYPILRWIQTPPEIVDMAADYLGVFLCGLVMVFVYHVIGGILRGLGDSRTPLILLVYSTVINIVLDPILILGLGPVPKLGVAGAALASVIAQTIAAAMAVNYLVRTVQLVRCDWKDWRIERALTMKTLRIGLPAGAQQTSVSLSMVAVMVLVNRFGSDVVAAYGAGMRVDQFLFLPIMTLGMAVSALVGQNLGAGEYGRVAEVVRTGVTLAVGIALVFTVIVLAIPGLLVQAFVTEPEVIALGVSYLRIIALSFIPFAIVFVFVGVLRGAGDTIPTMIFSILTLWVIRIPLAGWMSQMPALAERGIWIAYVISATSGAIINIGYYLTGRWRFKAVTGPIDKGAATLDEE